MQANQSLVVAADGRDIMLAVAANVPGAFELLVKTYERRIKAAIARHVPDRAAVNDLCQDVLLRIYRARDRYEPSARFETFLYRIIFNLCVNHTQYHRRRRALSLDQISEDDGRETAVLTDESAVRPDQSAQRAEQAALVRRATESLPATQRRALMLSRFEGLSTEEVATKLGLSEQAVKSLLWRARENLRKILHPRLGADFGA